MFTVAKENRMSRTNRFLTVALPFVVIAACSTEPDGVPVDLSFSGQAPAAGATADITIGVGANTVVITKAQMVVRRVKLKPVETAAAGCTDDDTTSDDCATVQTG